MLCGLRACTGRASTRRRLGVRCAPGLQQCLTQTSNFGRGFHRSPAPRSPLREAPGEPGPEPGRAADKRLRRVAGVECVGDCARLEPRRGFSRSVWPKKRPVGSVQHRARWPWSAARCSAVEGCRRCAEHCCRRASAICETSAIRVISRRARGRIQPGTANLCRRTTLARRRTPPCGDSGVGDEAEAATAGMAGACPVPGRSRGQVR